MWQKTNLCWDWSEGALIRWADMMAAGIAEARLWADREEPDACWAIRPVGIAKSKSKTLLKHIYNSFTSWKLYSCAQDIKTTEPSTPALIIAHQTIWLTLLVEIIKSISLKEEMVGDQV